jgi:hypothetical protein
MIVIHSKGAFRRPPGAIQPRIIRIALTPYFYKSSDISRPTKTTRHLVSKTAYG